MFWTVDSLNRKFEGMQRKWIPAGDLLLTEDVRREKNLRYIMKERADLGVAEEAEDEIKADLLPILDIPEAECIEFGLEKPTKRESIEN